MIYALRSERFCALKVAILKVQTFWAYDERVLSFEKGSILLYPVHLSPFAKKKVCHKY